MGDPTRFWNKWRLHFRLCRIAVLLSILALVCFVLWLNQIGLPDFVKQPLLTAVRQHGIELQFVRLRLNFVRGLVADNVRIGGEAADGPSLSLQEVQLQLDFNALLHRKLQLNGIVLRQGTFTLPLSTNDPQFALTVDHIQTELRFQTNDVWSLDNFQATYAGAQFRLSGQLTHASSVSSWEVFHRTNAVRGVRPDDFRKMVSTLREIHFNKASTLSLNVNGDARDLNSFSVYLQVNAPAADTPWGSAHEMQLSAFTITPFPKTNTTAAPSLAIQWKAQLAGLQSKQLNAGSLTCEGLWRAPAEVHWNVQLSKLTSQKLDADFVSCDGSWNSPDLEITNLYARLGGGELQATVEFNSATRRFSFTDSSCFNLSAIAALLTEKTRERLGQFTLAQPPEFEGNGSMVLPAGFDNSSDTWRTNVQPTICLNGKLAVTNASVSGVSFNTIQTHFAYSNEIWTVPDAAILRPEGRLEIHGTENDETKAYHWHLHGVLDPDIIRPFLTDKAARQFQNFIFSQPVDLDTTIDGRLYDYDSIIARGHAGLKKFSIRGETVDNVQSDFHYAGRAIDFYHPHLEAGQQTMHADGVRLDIPGDRVYFTNGLGTAYPQEVADAIGPIPAQTLRPYHFLALTTARVNGYAPLHDSTNADLDFQAVGPTPVGWYKIKTSGLTGEIHWIGQTLFLTNMAAPFYDGYGTANAFFDFKPHKGANYNFTIDLHDVNVHALAMDLSSPTNHLEGRASGHFVVTSAYSGSWHTCDGYGYASFRDGLLWDVPVFGILSPVLNVVSPGLGNSRATDASAQFFMTNGVIHTDKLEIHTTIMRLDYNGSVDLMGDLDAHVTAELFRDVPGVGGILSTVSWPATKVFESKVTRTIKNPQSKPIYLPRIFLYMLHPIHTLEDWLPGQSDAPK